MTMQESKNHRIVGQPSQPAPRFVDAGRVQAFDGRCERVWPCLSVAMIQISDSGKKGRPGDGEEWVPGRIF